MSDNEDFDCEFQGLKLKKSSSSASDSFNKPLETRKLRTIDENEVDDWFGDAKPSKSPENPGNATNSSGEFTFSGSFLEESLFAKGHGFGDASDEDSDDVEGKIEEKEEFVGIDWDANTIFKNLACPEMNSQKSVCVLRLHDVLTKSEQGVHKITRQMMHCGKRIQGYNPQETRDLGFSNVKNLQDLNKMLISLRSSINLMLLETEDLQKSINPSAPVGNSPRMQSLSKILKISGGILVAAVIFRAMAEKPTL